MTAFFGSLAGVLYRWFYLIGMQNIRRAHRFSRWIGRAFLRFRRWLAGGMGNHLLLPLKRYWHRVRGLFRAFPQAFGRIRAAAKQGFFHIFPCIGALLKQGAVQYRDELLSLWCLAGPIIAVLVLFFTVNGWTHTDFCLRLTYGGEQLGYIDSENTYEQAASLALARVVNVDDSFSVEAVPTVAVTVQKENQHTLSDTQLCDAILRTAGDAITDAVGLYVDGRFLGAAASDEDMLVALENIKDAYYDKTDDDQRAEFVQNVETVSGLFPTVSVVSVDQLKSALTAEAVVKKTYTVLPGDTLSSIAYRNNMTIGELRNMNPAYLNTDTVYDGDELLVQRPQPFLQVKVIKTIRYTEKIDYNTQYVNVNDKPVTYNKVKTEGVEGSQDIVAEVIYIDGLETERTVISTDVTKEPVTKVIERGTKKVVSSGGNTVVIGDGVSHGSMQWPVPICHNYSRGFGYGHSGVDICNGPVTVRNKPAVAADGGTVVSAGWNGGYGNYVQIRHANGLCTAYGHLNSISVVSGQTVSRGQQIGLIGSTGDSSGPHLHFEVIRNGVRVNPLNYVR